MTQKINEKQKNIIREIELINLEYKEDIKDYLKGEYITTLENILDDYFHEIELVIKKLKYTEEQ